MLDTRKSLFFFPVALLSLLASFSSSLTAGEKQNLYERAAQAKLIVLGTIVEDDSKYAVVHIEETLKGKSASDVIQVSFRIENFERKPGEEKITFKSGERVILFLEPVKKSSGKLKENTFALVGRSEGKIASSAESLVALVEAIKRFVRIQSLDSQLQIWEEQKKLLAEKNRFMVEAGFQEVIKFRTVRSDMIPRLLEFVRGEHPSFRSYSLILLKQLFEEEARGREKIEGREEVIRELVQRARGDEDSSVRVEAVRALAEAGTEDQRELLEAISNSDASQEVRYEAQKALYEMTLKKSGRE